MKVKIKGQSAGPAPSERVVVISTVGGTAEVIVHKSQIEKGTMEVGVIAREHGKVLIELPRETMSGRWRVWVPEGAEA